MGESFLLFLSMEDYFLLFFLQISSSIVDGNFALYAFPFYNFCFELHFFWLKNSHLHNLKGGKHFFDSWKDGQFKFIYLFENELIYSC